MPFNAWLSAGSAIVDCLDLINGVKLVKEGNKDEKEVQKEEVKAYSYAIALSDAFATLHHVPPYACEFRAELSLGLT